MSYTRNPEKVSRELVTNDSGQVICKSDVRIHTPVRFVEKELSVIGVRTYVFGWHPIILASGDYAVCDIPGRLEITPAATTMVTVDGEDYYEFFFPAGNIVVSSGNVVQDDKIIYFIIDELHFQSKVPWFMDDNDLCRSLINVAEYADSKAGEVMEVLELMVAISSRDKENPNQFLRHLQDIYKDKLSKQATFVPLTSVHLSVTNTIDRIAGNYFEPAIEGVLVNPSKKANTVEKILRHPTTVK